MPGSSSPLISSQSQLIWLRQPLRMKPRAVSRTRRPVLCVARLVAYCSIACRGDGVSGVPFLNLQLIDEGVFCFEIKLSIVRHLPQIVPSRHLRSVRKRFASYSCPRMSSELCRRGRLTKANIGSTSGRIPAIIEWTEALWLRRFLPHGVHNISLLLLLHVARWKSLKPWCGHAGNPVQSM